VKLSGGLDSACVAAGLAATGRPRALALARTFPDYPQTDESELIRQTAAATGLKLIEMPYSDASIVGPMRGYVRRWALPPGSPNLAVWPPLMAEARARGVDGLLDGEGGDEIFGTWPYLMADELRRRRLRAAWHLTGMLPGIGQRPGRRLRLEILWEYGVGGCVPAAAHRLWERLGSVRNGAAGPFVQRRDVRGLLAQQDDWRGRAPDGPIWWRAAVDSLVSGRERLDASGHLRREALDGGVDPRHPFLHDARLIETMLAFPPEAPFQGIRDRGPLRDGLAGRIPESVCTRYAKSYFNEVSARMLDGRDGSVLLDQLRARDAPIRGYVRSEGLETLAGLSSATGLRRYQLAVRLFRLGGVDIWLRSLAGEVGAG
jgi:asparagine synthetase B (glutamine-hydrolysing)